MPTRIGEISREGISGSCHLCGGVAALSKILDNGMDGIITFLCDEHKSALDNVRIPYQEAEVKRRIAMDGQILKEGTKKDEGKPRWELIAYDALGGIAQILTLGAVKYAARNWEKGIMYGRVYGAIMRHLTAWWSGDSKDKESGLSHLDHAMCELMFLSAYEKRGMTQFDDRPVK